MSISSAVGGFALPAPVGALNASIDDLPVVAMLDYLGFWLRDQLNPAIAQVQGASADICPVGNIFPYDPGSQWVRNDKPALYGWWSGDAVTVPHTLVFDARQRMLTIQWVYDELYAPLDENDDITGVDARNGYPALVDAVIRRAISRGKHPSYGFNGAAAGTPIWRSMGVFEVKVLTSKAGRLSPVPGGGDVRESGANEGHIIRYNPAVIAQVMIKEKMLNDAVADPGDVQQDSTMTILTTEVGDPLNPAEFGQVVVQAPETP